MSTQLKTRQSEPGAYVKRMPEVAVGDLIQYRYTFRGLGGMTDNALDSREVIEVVDRGAVFVVEGFYNVNACQVTDHISMVEDTRDAKPYWFCGERDE